jgi:cell division protein FtsB
VIIDTALDAELRRLRSVNAQLSARCDQLSQALANLRYEFDYLSERVYALERA